MPNGVGVSGLESDGGDRFFCGGKSGTLRAVRRPKREDRERRAQGRLSATNWELPASVLPTATTMYCLPSNM